jgi:uncharacterized protein YkwD
MNRYQSSRRPSLLVPIATILIAAGGFALAEQPAATTKPAATAPAASDHYRMTFSDFLKSEAAQRPIDLQAVDHALIEAAILHETNRVRAEHQLPALAHDPKLAAAARMHGDDMVAGDFFAHENPDDAAKREPIDRVKRHAYDPRYVAENIATAFAIRYEAGKAYYPVPGGISYSQRGKPIEPHTHASFAKDLVQRWMDSPGHRANILAKEPTQLGAGIAVKPAKDEEELTTLYAVQNFGAPMRPSPARDRR